MNKADKILIVVLVVVSCLLYVPLLYTDFLHKDAEKEVVVIYKDQEILRVDLNVNDTYEVDGTLDKVVVEVQDGKVRVEKETSPNNICSIQGWVEDANRPIICLPNDVIIKIEASNGEGVDSVTY